MNDKEQKEAAVKAPAAKAATVRVRAEKHVCCNGQHIFPGKEAEIPESEFKALGGLVTKVAAAVLGLFLLIGTAQAQQYQAAPLVVNGGTTNEFPMNGQAIYTNLFSPVGVITNACTNLCTINVNTASNYTQTIGMTKWDQCALQLNAKLMAAGTSLITAVFDASCDGTNWIPGYQVLQVPGNGTTTVTTSTNVTMNSIGYLRLNYVTNANNAILTNLTILVTTKPSRTGS